MEIETLEYFEWMKEVVYHVAKSDLKKAIKEK